MTPIKLWNSKPDELHKILMTNKKCAILLDDIFGKTSFEIKRYERWQPRFEELYSYKGFGNPDLRSVFIIITLRNDIYSESLRYLRASKFSEHNIFADKYIVDLAMGYKMDRLAKLEMLDNYSNCHKEPLSKNMKWDIATTDTPLGFPHLCYLYFNDKNFRRYGVSFFTNPFELLVDHMEYMFEFHFDKFVTLCVVLLFSSDSCLPVYCLLHKNDALQELLGKFGQNRPDAESLKKNLKSLQGVFLSFNISSSTYEFSHTSVRETVFIVSGRKYLDVVLSYCGTADLNLVWCDYLLHDGKLYQQKLVLSSVQYTTLYDKMYAEIIQNPYETANLKIVQQTRFVSNILRYFKQKSCLKNLLAKRYTFADVSRVISRHSIVLGEHSPSLVLFCYRNPALLSQIIEFYDPHNSWFRREKNFTLQLAMSADCPQVVEIILHYGAVHYIAEHPLTQSEHTCSGVRPKVRHCLSEIDDSSFELLEFLSKESQKSVSKDRRHTETVDEKLSTYLEKVREFQQWSQEKKDNALQEACTKDNLSVFKFILQQSRVTMKKSHLHTLMKADDGPNTVLEYILTIRMLNQVEKSDALMVVFRYGHVQKAQLLIADGIHLDDGALQLVAGLPNDSYEMVELIYNSREWDNHLTEFALQTACMKGNVEVVNFFIKTGTEITDACLVLGAYSPKAIPLYSIFSKAEGREWSDDAVNKAVEIACTKQDFVLLECILNIKRTRQALAIASNFPDDYSPEQIVHFLLEKYQWSTDEKHLALAVACDTLNSPIFKLLKNVMS